MYKIVTMTNNSATIENIKSGKSRNISLVELRQLYSQGKIETENSFMYEKRKAEERTVVPPTFLCYTKTKLDNYIKEELAYANKNSRDFVNTLKESKSRLILISGIRLTGQHDSILRYIRYLRNKQQSVCLITLMQDVSFDSLIEFINTKCAAYQYIVIENITRCFDFVNGAAYLLDAYILEKKQFIITGDDSHTLDRVKNDTTLFDRVQYINTTIILYSEYKRIFDKSLSDYINNTAGLYGTLKVSYKGLTKWVDETLVKNVAESRRKNPTGIFTVLSKEEISYYIYVILVKQFLSTYAAEHNKVKKEGRELYNQANSLLLSKLVPDYGLEFSQNKMLTVLKILENMQVLVTVPNIVMLSVASLKNIVITVPYINYSLSQMYENILSNLCKENSLKPIEDKAVMLKYLLKNIIISNLWVSDYKTYFCYIDRSFAVDIVVETENSLYFFEVKGNAKKETKDFKHLHDTITISRYFQNKPYKKFVLYMGETEDKLDDCYINIEDFLLTYKDILK